jgi:parallel beta-helix repeat protein
MAIGPVVEVLSRGTDPIDVKIEGITISGAGIGSVVKISGQASVEVRDCAVSGRHHGVQVSDSASLTLTGCTVSDSAQRGITLTGSARTA